MEYPLQFRCKFITLQIGMKGLITKVFAALLVGWYLMCIIGFGVHTCSGSGKSFLVPFFESLTCEEIHPEHSCDPSACCASVHEHGCCSHCGLDQGLSLSSKSCCSNDYQVLELTGILVQDDSRSNDGHSSWYCPCVDIMICDAGCQISWKTIIKYIHEPESGKELLRDRQAVLSVWRI